MESPTTVTGPIFLPLRLDEKELPFRLWFYEFPTEGRWIAAVAGEVEDGQPVPLRIESACIFGHVFHSAKCDCGYQLDEAFRHIRDRGRGIVIYGVDQDARGLGIATHFKIYVLRQTDNLDTDEVYSQLNAPVDARIYDPVAVLLRDRGIQRIHLLSNNAGRVAFLEQNGFDVVKQPLEMPLDAHNMATLMLEKEDLGYEWSFMTHRDWLEPIQAKAQAHLDHQLVAVVDRNEQQVAEASTDDWQLAPALMSALAGVQLDKPIVYLTDFPRLDELDLYATTGARFVVVPFPIIPEWLDEAGAALGIKIQDWGRSNRYKEPRPQWQLVAREPEMDVYQRGEQLRCVLLGAAAGGGERLETLLALYVRTGQEFPGRAPRVTRHSTGPVPWIEVAKAQAPASLGAGGPVRTMSGLVYLAEPVSPPRAAR